MFVGEKFCPFSNSWTSLLDIHFFLRKVFFFSSDEMQVFQEGIKLSVKYALMQTNISLPVYIPEFI